MRRATMSTAWLMSEAGEVEGLSLGSDACTEHECGIDGLRDAMGTPKKFENGIADRKATRTPPALGYGEYITSAGDPAAWLVVGNHRNLSLASAPTGELPPHFADEIRFSSTSRGDDRDNTACAWDEDGAFIHVKTTEHVKRLAALHLAIAEGDIAFGGDLVDRNRHDTVGGLVFVRPSQVPPHIAAEALEKDQKVLRLRAAAAKLGLEAELRQAGKEWFALSPRWKDAQESEVVFWLNPMHQQDYHCGCYNVEQLRQWARGEGPIMIDKPLRALSQKHRKDLEGVRRQMSKHGYQPAHFTIEWKDDTRREPVVRACYYSEDEDPTQKRLEDNGLFDLADLKAMFPKPEPVKRKPLRPR